MNTNNNPSIQRTLLRRGAKFDFELLTYPAPDGSMLTREVVRHPGAVVILPLIDEPETSVVFVRVFRPALEAWSLELPAGTREPDEQPAATARRELVEETGYAAATIEPLLRFHTSPGLSDEVMWAFLARGLREVGARPEADERLKAEVVPARRVAALIEGGELADGKSLAALLLAERRGFLCLR